MATADITKKSRLQATKAVVAMCLMYVVITGVMWNTMTLYASPVSADWGITVTQFMVSVSILGLMNAVIATFFYGVIQAHMKMRTMLIGGCALTALGLILFVTTHSLTVLYIAATIIGIGISPLNANTAYIILGAWYTKSSASKVGLATTFGSVGGIVFTALYGVLIARLGWHIPLWITTIAVIILIFLLMALYQGTPAELGLVSPDDTNDTGRSADDAEKAAQEEAPAEPEIGVTVSQMLRSPRFYILLVGYILVGLAAYAAFSNLAPFTVSAGYEALSGTVLSVALIGSAATMFLGGVMVDKVGSKWFILLCMILVIAGMFLLSIGTPSLVTIYIAAALLGIGYNSTMVAAGITVREAFGTKDYGKKVGLLVGPCFIGLSLAPTVFSAVAGGLGTYQAAFYVFIVIAAAAAFLVFIGCAGAKYRTPNKKAEAAK